MTGISAVGAFATIIIGAIGILMILEGGHAILSNQMTLGDFFMYGVFIGLVALPLINIASIGTQITEAFAGLDRSEEHTSELQSPDHLVCRLLLEKKKHAFHWKTKQRALILKNSMSYSLMHLMAITFPFITRGHGAVPFALRVRRFD